jgi:hypothetical protein
MLFSPVVPFAVFYAFSLVKISGFLPHYQYYDTDGIWKIYQYNQTIDITSLNFYCLGKIGIQIWYRNKQYFVITDIVI